MMGLVVVIVVLVVCNALTLCVAARRYRGLRIRYVEAAQYRNRYMDLTRELELFQSILDNAPVGILIKDCDNENRYLLWNDFLEKETGLTADRVIGRRDGEIEPWPGMVEFTRTLDEETIRKGKISQDICLDTKNGQREFYRTIRWAFTTTSGRRLILETCRRTTGEQNDRNRTTGILENQQRLINRYDLTCDCLQYMTTETNAEKVYQHILNVFSERESFSRAYIYFTDGAAQYMKHSVEWYLPALGPIPDEFRNIEMASMPYTTRNVIRQHNGMVIDVTNNESDDCFVHWREMEQIRFVALAPLQYRNRIVGMIGFDYRKVFQDRLDTSQAVLFAAAKLTELCYARDRQLARQS